VYMDHAAVGPLTMAAHEAISQWSRQALEQGDVSWPQWSAGAGRLRQQGAQLINAPVEEVFLIPNTSTGISLLAEGWRWRPGESVVLASNEFSSNRLPWEHLQRRGGEVRLVDAPEHGEISIESILQAIDSTTRWVAISWVGYLSGYRIDLGRLCEAVHTRGALLMVDAIQGLGVYPLDASQIPIDFLAADGHKWMLGPEGIGLARIRMECLERLDPVLVGWRSVEPAGQFSATQCRWKPNASRLEPGSANHVGILGLSASLQVLMEAGASGLEACILAHRQEFIEQLQRLSTLRPPWQLSWWHPSQSARQSGIVSVSMAIDPVRMRKKLLDAGIVTSVRGGRLRFSLHAYHTSDELKSVVEAMEHAEG
ncbi:MAG: aminotransferase class V-fold PLP-dependent enzyme, partial [Pirellulaceae bacterium]